MYFPFSFGPAQNIIKIQDKKIQPKMLRIAAASATKFMNSLHCCFTQEQLSADSIRFVSFLVSHFIVSIIISHYTAYSVPCVVFRCCLSFIFLHLLSFHRRIFCFLFIIFSCCWSSHFIIAVFSPFFLFYLILSSTVIQRQMRCQLFISFHKFNIRKLVEKILQHLQTKFQRF